MIIPCPMCGTERDVSEEELQLIIECNQFMCWDECGMDIFLPPMYLFFHLRGEDDD
jgi:hypothetical protein